MAGNLGLRNTSTITSGSTAPQISEIGLDMIVVIHGQGLHVFGEALASGSLMSAKVSLALRSFSAGHLLSGSMLAMGPRC